MAYSYIYPSIISLPAGYDCTLALPMGRIADRLPGRTGQVDYRMTVFREGAQTGLREGTLDFEDGRVRDAAAHNTTWPAPGEDGDSAGADGGAVPSSFLELAFRAPDDELLFTDKRTIGFYSIHTKPGEKSFFSDNAYKFGAPPIISQIAAFRRYVEGYPVVHIDRARDLGETLTLINPYHKPVLARVVSSDGRRLPRLRVPAMSARNIRLVDLLRPDETAWRGQIQLTANNRLVPYHVKHSLEDPRIISDHEHLDPFRDDPTHMPFTLRLRQVVGAYLETRRRR